MQVRILGPLEVWVGSTQAPIRPGRPRKLLVMLVLRLGERVSAETLIDALWDEKASVDRGNALRVLVSYLRRALAATEGAASIETVDGGYRLVADRDVVDAYQLEAAVADVARAPGAAAQLEVLNRVLAAWRGPPVPEVADEEFAQADLQRIHEVRLAAVEQRIDALIQLGRDAEALAELQQLVVIHPLRERFYAQLMTALYRSGRQAEALAVYERARRMLAEELGLDPGPELRGLAQAVLEQSPQLGAPTNQHAATSLGTTRVRQDHSPAEASTAQDPAAGAAAPSAGAVPRPLELLIGRESDLEELSVLLRSRRLVTLTGPGGAGKTRLAAELAGALESPAWWTDLSPTTSAEGVLSAVARAMDAPAGVEDSVAALVGELGQRGGLLVLDTCERVRSWLRPLLEAVLRECPRLHVLATSRQPVGVATELVWPVPPLSLPDPESYVLEEVRSSAAVRLFVERAGNRRPGFRVTPENCHLVGHICHLLDGLPLAIELAAAHAGVLDLHAIVRVLDDRLRLLVDEDRGDRQHTLRATIGWSYELLTADEALFFERLSVFAGPFPFPAAEAVAGDGLARDALELLLALTRQSLVAPVDGDRFRLLDTIRAFAAEGLERRPADEGAARRRHAAWYAEALTEVNRSSSAVRFAGERRHLRDALPDLRQALAWCFSSGEDELGARLLSSLWWLWPREGALAETASWFPRAKRLVPAGSALQADLLQSSGSHALARGNLGTALEEFTAAAELHEALGHPRSTARALLGMGIAQWGLGHYGLAARAQDGAADLFDLVGDVWGVALSLSMRARTAIDAGEPDVAARLEAAEAAALRSEDDQVLAFLLVQRARVDLAAGRHAEAAHHAAESLRLNERNGHREGALGSLHLLGLACLEQGETERAADSLDRALRLAVAMQHAGAAAESLDNLAVLEVRRHRLSEAAALLAAADELRTRTEIPRTALTAGLIAGARETIAAGLDPAAQAQARLRGTTLNLLDQVTDSRRSG